MNLDKYLTIAKYSLMILIIGLSVFVVFFDENRFCVEATGRVDVIDAGKVCFKDITEANEYKIYLIDKYNLNQEQTFNINYTFSE